jgi:hypothetical protein
MGDSVEWLYTAPDGGIHPNEEVRIGPSSRELTSLLTDGGYATANRTFAQDVQSMRDSLQYRVNTLAQDATAANAEITETKPDITKHANAHSDAAAKHNTLGKDIKYWLLTHLVQINENILPYSAVSGLRDHTIAEALSHSIRPSNLRPEGANIGGLLSTVRNDSYGALETAQREVKQEFRKLDDTLKDPNLPRLLTRKMLAKYTQYLSFDLRTIFCG